MKEKNTNKNQKKRDPWSLLQSQLGLLSSPVEHEQVSMVSAVDVPKEAAPETESPMPQEEKLDIEMKFEPQTEKAVETSHASAAAEPVFAADDKIGDDTGFDFGGFGDFGDCDIPPNAFGKPQKPAEQAAASRVAQTPVEEPVAEIAAEEPDAFAEPESDKQDAAFDPFASDELPTSLWQSRKPASVAQTPAKPSLKTGPKTSTMAGDSLSRQAASTGTPRDADRGREAAASDLPDDLPTHSSGKKRRDRSRSCHETSDDQPKRGRDDLPSFDTPRPEHDDKRRRSPRREMVEPKAFDDMIGDLDGFGGSPAFEESQPSRRRSRKPAGKTPYASDATDDVAFHAFENDAFETDIAADFGGGLNDETEKSRDRFPKRRRDRKPRSEVDESPRGNRNDFFEEEAPVGRSRQRTAPRPAPSRQEGSSAPVSPVQKIAVPNWDDAIGGIIEKNMERRPAKGERDRDRKGNGRGRRR